MDLISSNPVQKQYNHFPYPSYSLLARPRVESLGHLTLENQRRRAGLKPLPQEHARLLLLGCGTFEPTIFGKSHPQARILAVDISEKSLKRAKAHAVRNRVKNVVFEKNFLEQISGQFDYINCYGVLHHLKIPLEGFRKIHSLLSNEGIARIMVYSSLLRRHIFALSSVFRTLRLHEDEPLDPNLVKKFVRSLPPGHPLRSRFVLYRDSQSSNGIVDGFLHAQELGFSIFELKDLLDLSGLEIVFWQDLQLQGLDWKELAYLEATDQLSSNFVFTVKRKEIPWEIPHDP